MAADLARLGLSRELVEDAALLVSELVGNAVRYAHPLPGNVLRVSWEYAPGRLRLQVTDGGGRDRPEVRDAGPFDTRGRGLAIVDAVAVAWGVERDRGGASHTSTIWAELPVARANPSSASASAGRMR
jgi:serine/threonine-protein kinase RsbW